MTAIPAGRASADGRIGWLEQTVGGITGNIEHAIFTERHARSDGWLQRRDPRAKLIGFLIAIVAASLASSVVGLALLYGATLAVARASRVPFGFFVKRKLDGLCAGRRGICEMLTSQRPCAARPAE